MKVRKSQIVIAYLAGFAAATITGGAPIALMLLIVLFGVGSLAWVRLDMTSKLKVQSIRRAEGPLFYTPREGFVGVGHHLS